MTMDLETYKITDGQTPLSAETFNPRFYAIVRRLHALETVVIDWSAAVSQVQNYGLKRINEAIVPLVEGLKSDVAALLAEGDAQIAAQASALAEQLGRVDARIAAVQVLGQQEAWGPTYAAVTATIAYVGPQEILVDAVSPDLATGVHVQADCGEDGFRFGRILSATVAAGKTTVRCDWYEGSLTPALKAFTTLGESRLIYVVDLATPVAAATASAADAAAAKSAAEAAREVTRTYRDSAATAAAQAVAAANSFTAFRDELGIFPGLIRPTLNLHCASMLDDSVPIGTFARSTAATRLGPTGLIETVAGGLVRREWDVNGNLLGWLIEEQRTNLLTYSSQFDNVAWTKCGAIIIANAIIAPDGTTTMCKLVEDASLGPHCIIQSGSLSSTAKSSLSFFARAAERASGAARIVDASTGLDFVEVSFNLLNGTAVASTYGGGSGATAKITQITKDIYKISLSGVPSGTSNSIRVDFYLSNGESLTYTGDGTSGLYIWGAQLEAGAFPTSYIPTTSVAVTRSADVWTIPTSAFAFNESEGTLYFNGDMVPHNTYNALYSVNNGTPDEKHSPIVTYNGGIYVENNSGGVNQTPSLLPGSITPGVKFSLSTCWAKDSFAAMLNGGTVSTDTSGNIITGATEIVVFADWGGGLAASGHAAHLAYFPRRLSNSELQMINA